MENFLMGSSLYLSGGVQTTDQLVKTVSQSNSFSVGDVLRWDVSSGTYVKAQADSALNSEVVGVVGSATGTQFTLVIAGKIDLSAVGYLSGATVPVLFLSDSDSGKLMLTPPSLIGAVIKPILIRNQSTQEYVLNNFLGTQIGGSSTVAIDEIQPVGTVIPFAGGDIPITWLACDGTTISVSLYPELLAKIRFTSGVRAPMYGHVAVLTLSSVTGITVGDGVTQTSSDGNSSLAGDVIAVNTTTKTITVQTKNSFSSANQNFYVPNQFFATGSVSISFRTSGEVGTFTVTGTSLTHFNTPNMSGRFPLGYTDAANSAVSNPYPISTFGGEEKNTLDTTTAASGTTKTVLKPLSNDVLNNMPPYLAVRYIIKAKPYTRAAIIGGVDIPYENLLVGDLRDGTILPTNAGADLIFRTNDGISGIEQMRLSNAGKLGIGTTSPQTTLHISSSSPQIRLQDSDDTTGKYAQVNANSNGSQLGALFLEADKGGNSSSSSYVIANVGNTERLRVASANTTITHAANNHGAASRGNLIVGNGTKQLQFGVSDTNNVAWIDGWLNSGGLTLSIQPSGGRVGIGNTTPAVALDITGQARSSIGTTAGSHSKTLTTKDYVDSVLVTPTNFMPKATSNSGVGQIVAINTFTNFPVVLPGSSDQTWMYHVTRSTRLDYSSNGQQPSYAGVNAGGSQVVAAAAHFNFSGFAWRIS
jgi:hypothetical protein